MFVDSFKAGAFIALGCLLYLLIPAPMGAFFFALGLLSIGLTKGLLFTGQVHKLALGERSFDDLVRILYGNLSGILAMFLIVQAAEPGLISRL